MAAEVIVPEVTTTVVEIIVPVVTQAPDLHLNPVFDYSPLWGWPLWTWIFIGFAIILFIINMKWLRRKFIMKPVTPYLDALKGGKQEDMQTWMIGKNKSFYIQHLKYNDDGIISYFKYLANISMWYLGSAMAVGHAGGIKSVIVSDNYDMVRDPLAEIAFYMAIDAYNERHKEIIKDDQGNPIMDENGLPIVKYPIMNYDDYKNLIKELMREIPTGVKVPTFVNYDVIKATQFFPPNRTAGLNGGDIIRRARKMNIDQTPVSNWLKFAPLGIAFGLVVVGILLTYMFTGR